MKCVISVLGKDHKGIIAGVATCLAECGANIEDVSQTRLNGMFSMTMMIDLDTSIASFDETQQRLEEAGNTIGVQITIQREDVFRFMHSV